MLFSGENSGSNFLDLVMVVVEATAWSGREERRRGGGREEEEERGGGIDIKAERDSERQTERQKQRRDGDTVVPVS